MSYLILIRHSISTQDRDRPAHEWGLTEEGRQRCKVLAERLVPYQPDVFVTSNEPKAWLTGELTATFVGKPVRMAEGLHEHARHTVGWYPQLEDFVRDVMRFFRQPGQLVFGEETADACHERYNTAVERVLAQYPGKTVALVSHGSVMALYIARRNALDPFTLWQALKTPAFVVLARPDDKIVTIVNDVTV
jgi:broad specificity phosphatase PhoE